MQNSEADTVKLVLLLLLFLVTKAGYDKRFHTLLKSKAQIGVASILAERSAVTKTDQL